MVHTAYASLNRIDTRFANNLFSQHFTQNDHCEQKTQHYYQSASAAAVDAAAATDAAVFQQRLVDDR